MKLTSDQERVMIALWRNGGSTKRTAREIGLTRQQVRDIRKESYAALNIRTAHEFWASRNLPVQKIWRNRQERVA